MVVKTLTQVVIGLILFWAMPIGAIAYLLQQCGAGTAAASVAALWMWSSLLLVALLPSRPPKLVQPLTALLVLGSAVLG